MTNGEKIQTILDVDRDCTEVHGENGTMTFTVTQDFWDTKYKEPTTRIETIDYLCKHCPDDGECFKDCDEIKHLRQMPSVTPQEPKWIPVSERLPEAEYGESDSLLVCFENETQDVLYFNGSNWCYPTGEIYIAVNHKNGWHNKVVAWMSLPKPYEPQESEDNK